MNIPGFTGETSLYKTRGHYRAMASTPSVSVGGRGVLPQLPTGFCWANCDQQYPIGTLEHTICLFGCMEGPGGGDGGGGGGGEPRPHCRPRCTPCLGGSRTCLLGNCEEIEIPCGRAVDPLNMQAR